MKLDKKTTHFVISEIAGDDVITLVEYLKGKKNVSEFIIAQELEIEINIIRNMLYRLLDANLVSFYRKKDKQKGWYIYYWTYEPNDLDHLYWEIKKKQLQSLKDRLHREQNNVFFSGESRAVRLTFEKAIEFNYQCPETGELLEQEDNTETVKMLTTEIDELEKEIASRQRVSSTKKKPTKKKKS
ncbi:MAG: hypothetical protein ACMXYA_03155 [Candidatus Woesearchaeota archaeon]